MMATDGLADGAYDRLLTERLLGQLEGREVITAGVEDAESADVLGEHLGRVAARALTALRPEERVDAANRVLALLDPDRIAAPPETLLGVAPSRSARGTRSRPAHRRRCPARRC